MSFLHFGLLPYFLPLIAIPIILHLLTLHRLKTVELSTFRFLFDSYVQQRRRMKFLEALIAFLRTLFLLLLVLAIARPVVKHWSALFGGEESGRDIVLLIDTSASMSAVTDGQTSLDRAKLAAAEVVNRLGSDDRVTLIRVSADPEEICKRFSSDAQAIRDEIDALNSTPARANLFAALSQLFGPEGGEINSPTVYLFSDLQASGWSEFQDGQIADLIPEETELIVVNTGSNQELANLAVIGDAPDDQRAIAGLPVKLSPRVVNHSETETQSVPIAFFIDQKEIARETLTLEPGETAGTEFIYTPNHAGVHSGRFELPSDRFPPDDTFQFALNVAPQIQVLLVNGNPSAEPLENEGLYLRTAMLATELQDQSESETGNEQEDELLQSEQQLVRSLAIKDIPQDQVDAAILADSDVVILANCGGLNAPQFSLLREYVASGGGLLVFPGALVNLDAYNQQFFPSPELPDETFIAAELAAAEGDAEQAETFERFAAIDFGHPVFSVFSDSDERYLTQVHVYRRFPMTVNDAPGNSWSLIDFTDGSAALIESHYGNGRTMVSAFPLHASWTNLPMKTEFVPLVLRMIGHVKRRAAIEGPSVVPADNTAEFVVAQDWSPASGTVTDESGRVSQVTFQRSNSRLVGAFEKTDETGFYTLEVTGGRSEQPRRGQFSFAVNLAPEESDFTQLTDPQLSEMLPSAELTSIDASAEAQQLYGSIGDEREVWRPLILLTFLVIGIEFLLSTLGGGTGDDETPLTASQRLRDIARGSWVGRITGSGLPDQDSVK